MSNPKLKNFRRIVVKVGSSLLIDSAAGEVRASWLAALAADIAKLHKAGKDVLVVSSGSIALGRSRLKLPSGIKVHFVHQRLAFIRGLVARETRRPGRSVRSRCSSSRCRLPGRPV